MDSHDEHDEGYDWRRDGPRGKPIKAGMRVQFSLEAHEANVVSRKARVGTVLSVEEYGSPPMALSATVKWDELKTPMRYAVTFLDLIPTPD